jgi:hypothetical protein
MLANERSMLFGIEDVGGSDNPDQLVRYWSYARSVDQTPLKYNAAFLTPPSEATRDLLQIAWVITRGRDALPPGRFTPEARDGPWTLYRDTRAPPRASVLPSWSVVSTPGAALRAVTRPGFRVGADVILERPPVFPPISREAGVPSNASTSFRWVGPDSARIRVASPTRAILLVRNAFARGWEATVDGRPAAVQPADYLDQGVAVPPGHHVVTLVYRDRTIAVGLAASALAIAVLLLVAMLPMRLHSAAHDGRRASARLPSPRRDPHGSRSHAARR